MRDLLLLIISFGPGFRPHPHLSIFYFVITFLSEKEVQMTNMLFCNEKIGEEFIANTSNRHLHLHIGAKV